MVILEYAPPPPRRGTSFFTIAVAMPIAFIVLSTLILDGGASTAFCESAAGGFWIGAIIMAVRRRRNLTKVDQVYLVLGYPILLVATFLIVVGLAD